MAPAFLARKTSVAGTSPPLYRRTEIQKNAKEESEMSEKCKREKEMVHYG